jgi:hypothetical protein
MNIHSRNLAPLGSVAAAIVLMINTTMVVPPIELDQSETGIFIGATRPVHGYRLVKVIFRKTFVWTILEKRVTKHQKN